MRITDPRLLGHRGLTVALIGISSGLLLAACTQVQQPEPVPGQPLTWQQKHAQDMKKYQELGDARRQNNRPCPPSSCK
ncbi:hypothetical protein [Dongia sedimenti]|uniref:Lipoprotein n=1 Tax=Dongia sedimenti TaxID=3064282 RepID=A0ABU0YG47_9PROT|nr:hypothetical protein [Rhodospirillaceae bacterium R-7]